jgi:class 3 adenylate cyclase
MHFLFNARTNEKIMLNKDVYSIGTFSDSDTKLNFSGSLQIIIKKKRGQVILYKGCGKFQVNRKHTLKKVLEEDDEIFIGKEVFVFSLREEFDLKKSQIIYNSYLASMDSFSTESNPQFESIAERQSGRVLNRQPEPERETPRKPEYHSSTPTEKPVDLSFARQPARPQAQPEMQYERKPENFFERKLETQPEKPAKQSGGQSFNELLVLNDSFTKQISPVLEFDTLLSMITDLALENIKCDKAMLMLFDDDSKQLSVKTSLNFHQNIDELDKIAQKIVEEITGSMKGNSVFLNSVSIAGLKFIDTIILVKLSANKTDYGYLCLINKIFDDFSHNDQCIIELLGTHASLALDRINLYSGIKNETEVIGKLKKYLPTKTINRMIESDSSLSMKGELEVCSVLFVDICNFSEITSPLNPVQKVAFLNEYFTFMSKIVMTYNGNVNKFIGDGLMAVFGAPGKTPNHALEAALAALEMKKQINVLAKKFAGKFSVNGFNLRVGINTGLVTYGNVGSPQRMDFTVIGDNVNIASRLEEKAPDGGILISRSTYENIYSKIKVTPAQKIKVKGKSDLIEVYELIDKLEDDVIMQRGMASKIDYSVREHLRIAVKVMAIITKHGKPVQGLLRDISVGGVGLSLSSPGTYRVDDEILLSFKLNEKYNFKDLSGIIKHIKKGNGPNNGSNRQVMGIMFNNLSDEDFHNMSAYIENKCINWQKLPLAD